MARAHRPSVRKNEEAIVQSVLDHVNGLPRGRARKMHGGPHSQAGEPDVDACVEGRAVKAEAKYPGEVPTPIQYAVMRKWEAAGALAFWFTSLDEFRQLLNAHLHDRDWVNPQLCKHRHLTVSVAPTCEACGWVFPLEDTHAGRL